MAWIERFGRIRAPGIGTFQDEPSRPSLAVSGTDWLGAVRESSETCTPPSKKRTRTSGLAVFGPFATTKTRRYPSRPLTSGTVPA